MKTFILSRVFAACFVVTVFCDLILRMFKKYHSMSLDSYLAFQTKRYQMLFAHGIPLHAFIVFLYPVCFLLIYEGMAGWIRWSMNKKMKKTNGT